MDFKLLVARLKGKGLDIGEEAAAMLVEETLEWLGGEVLKTENHFDDLLVAVLPTVKKLVLAQVDKIDGEDDAGR